MNQELQLSTNEELFIKIKNLYEWLDINDDDREKYTELKMKGGMVLVKNNKEIHGINSEKDIIKLFVDLSNKITECANTLAQYYKNVKDSEDDYQRDPDDEYYKRTLNDRKHAKKRSEEEFKKYLNSLYNES